MKSILTLFLAILSLHGATGTTPLGPEQGKLPNFLFIAVDDLRPELGCYGARQMITPNMDRLAASGTIFDRAYCNVAVCGASRASLLSGIRPTENRFLYHTARQDKQAPDVPSLPEYLRQNGYYTVNNGKVYHYKTDTPESWTEEAWRPKVGSLFYNIPANAELQERDDTRGPAYEAADVPDNAYADGMTADKSINDLHRLNQLDQPFFLAVGFVKPHLPFNAPLKYWNLYDRDSIELADNHFLPVNTPEEALYSWGELRSYSYIPKEGIIEDEELARSLRHGYYAATSYTDAQVGRLLDTLDRLGLSDDTIVVLWGDHGWQLGEHTYWCKHTNFEVAVQVPLLIRDPRKTNGQRVEALVEYVDLYPTICELAGLQLPEHLQGMSMASLLDNPETEWKDAVFSRYGIGESIRTDRYRYTAFIENGEFKSHMLYDHLADPDENINIVDLPGMADVVNELNQRLMDHIAQRR